MNIEENELIDGVVSRDDESTDKVEGTMIDKEWMEDIENQIANTEEALKSFKDWVAPYLERMSDDIKKLSAMESKINAVEEQIKIIPLSGKVPSGWASIEEFMNDELNRVFIENYCEEKNWDIDELGHNDQKEIYRAKITKKD